MASRFGTPASGRNTSVIGRVPSLRLHSRYRSPKERWANPSLVCGDGPQSHGCLTQQGADMEYRGECQRARWQPQRTIPTAVKWSESMPTDYDTYANCMKRIRNRLDVVDQVLFGKIATNNQS